MKKSNNKKNNNKLSKNPDDYNLVFHEPKVPVIEVEFIKEHKDGTATYDFHFDEDFRQIVSDYLEVKKATIKQVGKYIFEMLEEAAKEEENNK